MRRFSEALYNAASVQTAGTITRPRRCAHTIHRQKLRVAGCCYRVNPLAAPTRCLRLEDFFPTSGLVRPLATRQHRRFSHLNRMRISRFGEFLPLRCGYTTGVAPSGLRLAQSCYHEWRRRATERLPSKILLGQVRRRPEKRYRPAA
jgi:hypothetical protein